MIELRPDPAEGGSEALRDALALAFLVLKAAIVLLLPLYLLSGVTIVRQHQRTMVLVFGRIRGEGDARVWQPGLHWSWPRPFAEIVKLDAGRVQAIELAPLPLPEAPGMPPPAPDAAEWKRYLLTGDANLIRAHWIVRYTVADPEAWLFQFSAADRVLAAEAERAVTRQTARFDVDRAQRTDLEVYRAAVEDEVRDRCSQMGLGVRIERVELVTVKPPRPVDDAFNEVVQAENQRSDRISDARAQATRRLNEAAGRAAEIRAEAEAYKVRLVAETRADAEYFRKILPQYRAQPDVIARVLRQDAIRRSLEKVKEKYLLHRTPDGEQELRLWLGPEAKRPSLPGTGTGDQTRQTGRAES